MNVAIYDILPNDMLNEIIFRLDSNGKINLRCSCKLFIGFVKIDKRMRMHIHLENQHKGLCLCKYDCPYCPNVCNIYNYECDLRLRYYDSFDLPFVRLSR